jgi:four helix bundle protein
MKTYFDHERLDVYQESIAFCGWVGDLLTDVTTKAAAKDPLDRASRSLPLNMAEGNGKFSDADRSRFLEVAHGSALECAACLDGLVVCKLISAERSVPAKSNSCASVTCSWVCSKDFRDAQSSCVRMKEYILTSMIMSRSMIRSTISRVKSNGKTFPA